MYRILLVTISVFVASALSAQYHTNAWLRATIFFSLPQKLSVDAEFQHRRQNGLDNHNMFDKNLLFSGRLWLHYQHNKNVTFSVSPVAYYANYKVIQQYKDESVKPNQELRFSAAILLQKEIAKNVIIGVRSAAEYRLFMRSNDIIRWRNRLLLSYGFTKQFRAIAYDELFFNITGVSSRYFFDQNRVSLGVEYAVLPYLKIETGYLFSYRLLPGNSSKSQENNFYLNLTFQVRKQTKTKP